MAKTEKDWDFRKYATYDARKKPIGLAYAFWFILGFFGAHRFYIGKPVSGVVMAVLTVFVVTLPVVFIWWIIDGFLLLGYIWTCNKELIDEIDR